VHNFLSAESGKAGRKSGIKLKKKDGQKKILEQRCFGLNPILRIVDIIRTKI
jgi:hypothetical protein